MKYGSCAILSVTVAILVSSQSMHAQELDVRKAKAAASQALMNAKQLHLALFEFESDYGSFPSEATRENVEKAKGAKLPADDKTSNAMLRQLFAAGIIEDEKLFFAAIAGAKEGDDVVDKEKALAKGENAFTYIAGLSTAGNPSRPLLLCPVIPGTTKFDTKPFGGKALVVCVDGSARMLKIEDDGRVLYADGDLLSKTHPLWTGLKGELDIRYPDLPAKE